MAEPRAFRTRDAFRDWLAKHHDRESELMLRLFKVSASAKGIGYKEALDEALCFGWIDGVRRALDADSFTQRFTPRKKKSNWSAVNIKRAHELIAEGRMMPPGRAAFDARDGTGPSPYSFENRAVQLPPELEREFKRNSTAWKDWCARPPYYRRVASFWVMSAKQEETRRRRFESLVERSAKGERLAALGGPTGTGKGEKGTGKLKKREQGKGTGKRDRGTAR